MLSLRRAFSTSVPRALRLRFSWVRRRTAVGRIPRRATLAFRHGANCSSGAGNPRARPRRRRRDGGKEAQGVKATKSVKTMAGYAMSFDRLGLWMAERAKSTSRCHPRALRFRYSTASWPPLGWSQPGRTPKSGFVLFSALIRTPSNTTRKSSPRFAATLIRNNAISNTLSTKLGSIGPLFLRKASRSRPRPC